MPSPLCKHNRQPYHCKDCAGAGVCKHGTQKHNCVKCGGSQICKHKKRRQFCNDCGGSQMCKHRIQRYGCIKCRGGGICGHGKKRDKCANCKPLSTYRVYIRDAKSRKLKFNLSFEEYLKISDSPCVYCGDRKIRNGIDRRNNSIGYTLENSVSCCSQCNYMKLDYSVEEFLAHAKRIASFQSKRRNK